MGWLDDAVTGIALCWRIERRDGVTIGLTAHDRAIGFDGLTYAAAPGMTPSAIERSASLDSDGLDVSGALCADAMDEEGLLAGRWDGARVSIFAVDWADPGDPAKRRLLGAGTIGAIETQGGGFTAELRAMVAALERPVVEETSPECRAMLGDARCRIPMAGRRRFACVLTAEDAVLTLDREEPVAGCYGDGRLRWITGANSGLESAIAASDGTTVTLRAPPFHAGTGARVELIEGCDKRLETCALRFSNAINFRGEPYLPGMDLLTRYPGG